MTAAAILAGAAQLSLAEDRRRVNPGTPSLLRGINDRAALDLLLEHGPLSRTQLGELTGLSKPTAVAAPRPARRRPGWCSPAATARGGPGPNAQLYEVNPDAAYVAGLDVTPTRILAAVADITGRTVGDYELQTPRQAPAPTRSHRVAARARRRRGRGRDRPRTSCTGSSSARRAPSTRRTGGCATPGTCPAGTTRTCSTGSPTRSACRSRSTTTSTSPRSPSMRIGAARGSQDFVLLWAREGHRRGRRHRRPRSTAARPAAPARSASCRCPGTPLVREVGATTPAASRSSPAASQVLALARALGLARRHARGRRHERRCAPRAPATSCSPTLGAPARARPRRDRRGARPGAGRPRRRRAHGGRRPAARPDRRRGRLAGAVPAPARADRRHREPGAARAPCRPPSPPPATTSSTPSDAAPRPSRTPDQRDDTMTSRTSDPDEPAWRVAAAARGRALAAAARGQRLHRQPPRAAPTTTRTRTSRSPSGTAGARRQRGRRRSRRTSTPSRTAQPEHPRQGRRQHHRRQDQPGAAGRRLQRARRRLVVHHRQRRAVLHLGRLRRPDAVHGEVRHRPRRRPSRRRMLEYTQYEGNQCTLPLLGDAYGLYYNKDAFAAAGITEPPKTMSEFEADAVKLTKTDGDTLLAARLHAELPRLRVDDRRTTPRSGRRRTSTPTASRPSATDPAFAQPCSSGRRSWSTTLGGYDKLEKYRTTFGDEFGAKNPFQTGQVAMAIDGEWRAGMIDDADVGLRTTASRRSRSPTTRPTPTARATSPAPSSASPSTSEKQNAAWEFVQVPDHRHRGGRELRQRDPQRAVDPRRARRRRTSSQDPAIQTFIDDRLRTRTATRRRPARTAAPTS